MTHAKFAVIKLEDNIVMGVEVFETYEDAVAKRYELQETLNKEYPIGIKYFYDKEDYFCAYSDTEFSVTYSVCVKEITNNF